MPEGFLLNGVPISQETYTELCNRFPDTYGDDAERLQREQRELRERAIRELSEGTSKSPVSLSPSATPSSKPPSKTSSTPVLPVILDEEEGLSSPEASLVHKNS